MFSNVFCIPHMRFYEAYLFGHKSALLLLIITFTLTWPVSQIKALGSFMRMNTFSCLGKKLSCLRIQASNHL